MTDDLVKRLRADCDRIEQLEAALREVANFDLYDDYSNTYEGQLIARAALGEKKDG